MKKNIIAISGSHGTGKTTSVLELAASLKKANPKRTIGLLTENAIDCPFPINADSTLLGTVLWLVTNQIQRELEASLKYDLVVSDRCILDPIAYGLIFFGHNEVTDGLITIAKSYYPEAYKGIKFQLCADNPYCFVDGLRDVDETLRLRVEEELLLLHSEMPGYKKAVPFGRRFEDEDCPLGGDVANDCEGCVHSLEYRYDPKTGECVLRDKEAAING